MENVLEGTSDPSVDVDTLLEEKDDDDDDDAVTLSESSPKNCDDNHLSRKKCDDTKEDLVDIELDDNSFSSSEEDEEEEMEEEWLPSIDKKSKKRKHIIASHQPTALSGVALGTDFSLNGGPSSLSAVPQQYKVMLDTSSPETKAIFDTWSPSVPFQWLACRYSKRTKMGYFGKCWDMVRIISEELGYTVAEYLNFRGWGFHRSLSKNNQPCLRYHRFEICMKQMPQEIVEVDKRGALSRHFAAMITSLFHVLKDAHQRVPSSIPRKFEDDFSTPARFGW